MQKHKQGKTPFKSGKIRELLESEKYLSQEIKKVIDGEHQECKVANIPKFISFDNKERSLILDKDIAFKIIKDHGDFSIENLIINAHDWQYVKINVDGNPDRINLVLQVNRTEGFLRIGAVRINGYFTLTHYENIPRNSQSLKNFLKGGNVLDRSGRTRAPAETGYSSFATPQE